MYKYIPKSILPEEYGGDAGPTQNLIGIVAYCIFHLGCLNLS